MRTINISEEELHRLNKKNRYTDINPRIEEVVEVAVKMSVVRTEVYSACFISKFFGGVKLRLMVSDQRKVIETKVVMKKPRQRDGG